MRDDHGKEKIMKALFISADRFEDTELLAPYYRFQEEGIEVDIASLQKGPITGKHGYAVQATKTLAEVRPEEYGILLLPGGKAPEALRKEPRASEIAREFFRTGKIVAAICHGPQILATAGLLEGRRATAYRTVAEEVRAAGAVYEDTEVVVDGNLVTSRQPSDIPAFLRETMKLVRSARSGARRAA
jgi:protease I